MSNLILSSMYLEGRSSSFETRGIDYVSSKDLILAYESINNFILKKSVFNVKKKKINLFGLDKVDNFLLGSCLVENSYLFLNCCLEDIYQSKIRKICPYFKVMHKIRIAGFNEEVIDEAKFFFELSIISAFKKKYPDLFCLDYENEYFIFDFEKKDLNDFSSIADLEKVLAKD
jgi:hypothetical protein